uniref:Putative structural protein n=1 Tax=viral metagenome TaxID=1070528 RepID=A0A6M3IF34_9ZZZZ
MKTLLKIGEMVDHAPEWLKDAIVHVAKDAGKKTDDLELHRHSHSEKAKVNGLDPASRKALKYVSYRTPDRDDEIVIPSAIDLKEFRKYAHVLVNHNYSLLPVGSDDSIEADDYGIKALTQYADTGEGTLANVVWALVSQGHMKASSVGFVPTSFTKPGDREWDRVANKLQSDWKEFDKPRAEKSLKRIITGGVLLEHSDVSVPCNTDASLIQIVKSMNVDEKLIKQMGIEMKGLGNLSDSDLRQALSQLVSPPTRDGLSPGVWVADIYDGYFVYVNGPDMFKQGYAVEGDKASLVGEPTPVQRRAVYITSETTKKSVAFGDCDADGVPSVVFKPYPSEHASRQNDPDKYKKIRRENDKFGEGIHAIWGVLEDGKTELQAIRFDKDKFTPEEAKKWLKDHEHKTVLEEAAGEEKARGDGRGVGGPAQGDGGADMCVCPECGATAKHERGVPCNEQKCPKCGTAMTGQPKEKSEKAEKVHYICTECDHEMDAVEAPDECPECGAKMEEAENEEEEEEDKEKKSINRVVKVVEPPRIVKVLFIPPDEEQIAKSMHDAVVRAISRRSGRLM